MGRIQQTEKPDWSSQIAAFQVRRKSFSLDYYVMAQLVDGTLRKVAKFPTKAIAEYWIEVECRLWLDIRGPARKAA